MIESSIRKKGDDLKKNLISDIQDDSITNAFQS